MDFGLYIGTIGTSVWFSYDLGETWDRPYGESGLYLECRAWSLQRALRIRRASSRAPTKGSIDGISPIGSGAIILRRWTGRRSGPWHNRPMIRI